LTINTDEFSADSEGKSANQEAGRVAQESAENVHEVTDESTTTSQNHEHEATVAQEKLAGGNPKLEKMLRDLETKMDYPIYESRTRRGRNMEEINDLCFLTNLINKDEGEPNKFQEAWNHPDPSERKF
jgi:hypothetical protein